MLTSFDGIASLARDIVRVQPAYATELPSLQDFLEGASQTPRSLPERLVSVRKDGTSRAWSRGASGWNEVASAYLAVLRRIQPRQPLLSALLDLFAADFGGRTLVDLEASCAIFPSHLILQDTRVRGACRLDGAQIMASLAAAGARFEHEFSAEQAQVTGRVDLQRIEIGRATRFSYAMFRSDVVLNGAVFHREFWVRSASFAGAFQMIGADLRHDASLGCSYAGPASFDHTHFADTVSFEGAVFKSGLSVDGCVFDGRLFLQGMQAAGIVTSLDAQFNGEVLPSIDALRRASVGADSVRLRGAQLH